MSKATTENQERTVATKGTDHVAQAVSPDMCFVPGKASPEPFDNYVESKRLLKGATTTVFISEQSVWTEKGELGPPSEPAHAGSAGGVKSGTYRFEAKATSYSRDVFCEGCAVVRTDDTTTQNHGNTDGIVLEGPLGTGDGSGVPGGDKAIVGHPVDAGTGRSFTDPIVDLSLPGPLLLTFCRAYSSSLATRDLGLGHGWTHSFAWQIELCPPGLQVVTSDGLTIDFARIPRKGRAVAGPGGWSVARRG